MNNRIMFFYWFSNIFVYMFFLLSIITKQHKLGKKYNSISDENDFDGIGNQGRVPNKKKLKILFSILIKHVIKNYSTVSLIFITTFYLKLMMEVNQQTNL